MICWLILKAVEDRNIESNPTLKYGLKILDKAFTVIFVFEMVVKMGAYGFKKYFTDAWCWLDFIIVAVRPPAISIPTLPNDVIHYKILNLKTALSCYAATNLLCTAQQLLRSSELVSL